MTIKIRSRLLALGYFRQKVRSSNSIVNIETTYQEHHPCRFFSVPPNKTALVKSFRQVVEDIRNESIRAPNRDTVAYITCQYTKLPALLSQPDGVCQRLEIIQSLLDETNKDDDASQPLYSILVDQFLETATADTLRFLLASRADMRTYLAYKARSSPQQPNDNRERFQTRVNALDQHFKKTLAIWFSPSVLLAQRIRYDQTPAAVIERIVRKEVVHPVHGWKDLHNRFGPHRRVYALVHPFLLDRPLVVIHVSLQATDIPDSMRAIYDAPPTEHPRVAAFYSITNLESGLMGIGLGEFLISATVNLLRGEFPSLQTFVTLSPMPNFRKWLETKHSAFHQELVSQAKTSSSSKTDHDAIKQDTLLQQLATHYIVNETTTANDNRPLDPVARFHLSNGAELYRIVTRADLSTRGQQNSFGVMVNYRYDLSRRMERKARYAQNARDFDVDAAIHLKSDIDRRIK